MPDAIASLAAAHSIVLPGEQLMFSLLLRNPTSDSLAVPLPASRWWAAARLTLTRPDGSTAEFILESGKATPVQEQLVLFEEAELEAPFLLDGRIGNLREPGWYELNGLLPTSEGDWPIAGTRWFVEPVLPMEAFVAPLTECRAEDTLDYWKLVRGERRSGLYRGKIGLADESCPNAVNISAGVWLADTGTGARSLTGMAYPGEQVPLRENWVAWLESNTLRAGVSFALFNTTAVELPGCPAKILPHLLVTGDGGAEAWLVSADQACVWRVRLHAPEEIPEPESPADDEDYFPDPRDLVRIAPPETLPVAVPAKPAQGAVARWKEVTAVALLSQMGAFIEVHYGVTTYSGIIWGMARIDEAEIVPGADPAISLDDRGVGRVGVLFRSGESLGIAALAFDAEAKPLWSNGVRRELTDGKALVKSGGISLRLDSESGKWICSWAIAHHAGTFLVSGENGVANIVKPAGKPLDRTMIAVWPGLVGAAYQTDEGNLQFATARDWSKGYG